MLPVCTIPFYVEDENSASLVVIMLLVLRDDICNKPHSVENVLFSHNEEPTGIPKARTKLEPQLILAAPAMKSNS